MRVPLPKNGIEKSTDSCRFHVQRGDAALDIDGVIGHQFGAVARRSRAKLHFNRTAKLLLEPLMDCAEEVDREPDQPFFLITVGKGQGVRAGSGVEDTGVFDAVENVLCP